MGYGNGIINQNHPSVHLAALGALHEQLDLLDAFDRQDVQPKGPNARLSEPENVQNEFI